MAEADALSVFQRMHQHRRWGNRILLAAAHGLKREELDRRFAIGQGSIWRTLTHLFAAEYVWLAALRGNETSLAPGDRPGELPGHQGGADALAGMAELEVAWQQLDQEWEGYLDTLTADELDEVVTKCHSVTGERYGTPRRDVLLHVCTHAQYTSSQLVNMLRQLGVSELPDVMLISMVRAEDGDRKKSESKNDA